MEADCHRLPMVKTNPPAGVNQRAEDILLFGNRKPVRSTCVLSIGPFVKGSDRESERQDGLTAVLLYFVDINGRVIA
jgi:hypothetical protein